MKLHQKFDLVRKLKAKIVLGEVDIFIGDDGKINFVTTIDWAGKPDVIFAEVLYLDQKGDK